MVRNYYSKERKEQKDLPLPSDYVMYNLCLEDWHIPLRGTSLFTNPAIDVERLKEYQSAKTEGLTEYYDKEDEKREKERTHAKLKEQLQRFRKK